MDTIILSTGHKYGHNLKEIKGFFGPWRFLSNFHYFPVELDGVVYKTNEHAYQAAKTVIPEEREKIRLADKPIEARRRGQLVTFRSGWEDIKLATMHDLNCQKYADQKLGTMLLESGDAYLEETNHWGDVFWGVCGGVGENHLGRILMTIRLHLKQINQFSFVSF